jgi:acid phosphatase type 7
MRLLLLAAAFAAAAAAAEPPASTLSGPARPVTVPLGNRGHAVDLPGTDPRVQRRVTGWAPEQIAVALGAAPASAWVSWVTGESQMGAAVEPLDPATVRSVVRYGLAAGSLPHEATGDSLVYSQLYPFEGLRNYTSGIIHHVRLQGFPSSLPPLRKIPFFLPRPVKFQRSLSSCRSVAAQDSGPGPGTTTSAATRPSPTP